MVDVKKNTGNILSLLKRNMQSLIQLQSLIFIALAVPMFLVVSSFSWKTAKPYPTEGLYIRLFSLL